MSPAEQMHAAMVNRSIRTVAAELEYLRDAAVISPQALHELLSALPAPLAAAGDHRHLHPAPHVPHSAGEKGEGFYNPPPPSPQPPPPAYNPAPAATAPAPPPLCTATALYAYASADAGDLELQPNDHVAVTEYMNAEWWKGRSARTGREGIFPRSYVRVSEEKAAPAAPAPPPNPAAAAAHYGNVPLETSQMGGGEGKLPGKGQEMGKKFGKKLGNAAIFGAGATMGGNLVNSIF